MPKPPFSPEPNPDASLDQTRTEAEALMAMLHGQSQAPTVEDATRRLPALSSDAPQQAPVEPPPDTS